MSGQPSAIEVVGLEKRYGAAHVLRGIDFDVRAGEVWCLLGPNGAGKTTTVEILEGFRAATAGVARVLGFDPALQPRELRARIGVVLQECGFPSHLRVNELVDAWRGYYPAPRPRDDLLDVVDLRGEAGMLVRNLSGGQRRRLDLALALAGDPALIFLDEPTTGFDPEARRRCWAAIGNLRQLGKTIVLTTHYLDEAERLSDRVAILTGGAIGTIGPPRALARQSGAPTRISFSVPDAVARGEVALPAAVRVQVENGRAEVVARQPTPALDALLAWARSHGLGELEDLAVAPPSLEDAYLHLVAGRDGDEA